MKSKRGIDIAIATVKDWCVQVVHKRGESKKAMASSAMLVSWEIWKEKKKHGYSKVKQ
jgi:hypothetical protein